jgi:arginase
MEWLDERGVQDGQKCSPTIPSHRPLPLEKLIYCGVHDLSKGQMRKLKSSLARVVYGKSIEHTLDYAKALREQLEKSRASTCIVHIDLDCLDTSIGKANEFCRARWSKRGNYSAAWTQ